MIEDDVKDELRNLNQRLMSVEQILPTLATRQDLSLLATKAEIALLATKAEVALLATKAEVALLATKAEVREEGETTRRHMDVIAEHLIERMAMLYEGHARHTERLDAHDRQLESVAIRHEALDQRVQVVERGRARRPR